MERRGLDFGRGPAPWVPLELNLSKRDPQLLVLASSVLEVGQRLPIDSPTFRIGRGSHNDLVIDDPAVAVSHLRIKLRGGEFVLDAKAPVSVDGRAPGAEPLVEGCSITIGSHALRFTTSSPTAEDEPSDVYAAAETSPGLPHPGSALDRIVSTAQFDAYTGDYESDAALRTAFHAVDDLTRILDTEKICHRAIEAAIEVVEPETARILLYGDDGQLHQQALFSSLDEGEQLPPISRTITRHVSETQRGVVAMDVQSDERFVGAASLWATGIRSLLCVPIARRDELLGFIYLTSTSQNVAFGQHQLDLLSAVAAGAGLALASARLYERLQTSLREQQELVRAQSRFVPDQFLQALGHRSILTVAKGDHVDKDLSILFSDLRGFTPLTERLGPAKTIKLLNRYFEAMEPAIHDRHGFIDEIVGDAILALFDTTTEDAIDAGIEMFRALDRFNADAQAHGQPRLDMGIGLNVGRLVLGTVGGTTRIRCGVVGDPVNLAARIESLTKTYGLRMLVSDAFHESLADCTRYSFRKVDKVLVVGRQNVVNLYEVYDIDPPELRAKKDAVAARYDGAWEDYYGRRFESALEGFESCLRVLPEDPTLRTFIARARAHAVQGVDDAWDGVVQLKSK